MHRNKIEMTGALVNMIPSVFLKYLFIDNWSAFFWYCSLVDQIAKGAARRDRGERILRGTAKIEMKQLLS